MMSPEKGVNWGTGSLRRVHDWEMKEHSDDLLACSKRELKGALN